MSSTNKTTKLGLSQFLGTDKPAWLGDYNADMQKIDDAFANLEQSGESSAAEIAALQQKDDELTQDITDVNDRVDTVSADIIAVGNRTTVLEGNYDTMHHELVLNEEKINESQLQIDKHEAFIEHTKFTRVYLNANTGDDNNDGLSPSTPMKTILAAYNKYHTGSLDFTMSNGEYDLPTDMRACVNISLNPENNATPTVNLGVTALANKIFSNANVTLVANTNVSISVVNLIIAGTFLINSGCVATISDGQFILGNNGKLTGEGKASLNRSFVVYSASTTVVDITNLVYVASLIMDKDATITANVTKSRSLIASELTV